MHPDIVVLPIEGNWDFLKVCMIFDQELAVCPSCSEMLYSLPIFMDDCPPESDYNRLFWFIHLEDVLNERCFAFRFISGIGSSS